MQAKDQEVLLMTNRETQISKCTQTVMNYTKCQRRIIRSIIRTDRHKWSTKKGL